MWLLKKVDSEAVKYLVSKSKTYTVGRKNCDIILEEDASISRKHCTVYIAKQNECPFPVNTLTGIWIVDEQSKYGTYLKSNNDWIKLNPNQNKKLSNGCIVKFGLIENVWSVEYKPLIVCTSGIQTEQKKQIETTLLLVDGCLRNTWCKDCSMLVVNEITLTIKVVLALINGVPIVTPSYVEKVVESINNQTASPNYESYRPAIKESILDVSLVSLDIKQNRKELFKGLKFVIPTRKQLETLKEVIVSAGGKIELFTSAGSWERFAEESTVLIQLPLSNSAVSEELVNSYKEIASFLKNNYGRRIIPESEIAQAVAYSSVEKYCNSKSTCFNLLRTERHFDPGSSLVHETPEITRVEIPEPHVIPSSTAYESQFSETLPSQPSGSKAGERPKKATEDRKRTHSPNQFDEEFKAKKVRSGDRDVQKLESCSLLNPKILEKKSIDTDPDSSKAKKTASKATCITNFFQKQSKSAADSVSQASKLSNPKFWNEEEKNEESSKRKLSTEGDDFEKGSDKKRVKIPEVDKQNQLKSEVIIQIPKSIVEVVQQATHYKDSVPSLSGFRRSNDIEKDDDFADYIEREKTDELNRSVDDLNKTIFSLNLISSAYLKNDGSLIDPPSVPVNVKKFRKQKVFSSMVVVPFEQNENDLSDGEWIEPHSERLNISVGDRENW